ncbi:MAG: hypothetical protein ACFFCP_10685 [Promethearchaeota archaeon]
MGETYSGSATPLTEQRTDQMMIVISITLVLVLVVGGFSLAANLCGSQNEIPTDNNQQNIVMDHFDPAGTAPLQAWREPDFVMESESGTWGTFNTKKGYIWWDGTTFPALLPLCINNDTLAGWSVSVLSYGGYEPFGGSIVVCQKGENKGTIYIKFDDAGKGDYECCAYNWWTASFYVKTNFCIESNQYPDLADPTFSAYIPGKAVDLDYVTDWTGCGHKSQDFTVIHSHSYRAFSERFILTLQTHTLTTQFYPTHSVWYSIKTAIVYNIFEPKRRTTEVR